MILADAGPIVAILDQGDAAHRRCADILPRLQGPLLTTWPAFTEAMYLLDARLGWPAQEALWQMRSEGELKIADLDETIIVRASELMKKYRDQSMGLADASLVALAESLSERRIFTLDSDFRVYRLHGRRAFEIIP